MEEILLLELEIMLLQDNIKRIRKYKEDNESEYQYYASHVFGEFKHRLVALKQRCTLINKLSTKDLW